MNIHKLARTTPASRALIAARRASGLGEGVVAEQLGVDRKTVRKWTRRQQVEGAAGLHDRSSRPVRSPGALSAAWKEAVLALRRLRFTQAQIATWRYSQPLLPRIPATARSPVTRCPGR